MSTLGKLIVNGLYKEGTPLRLHLGCGATNISGYINIDFPQSEHPVMIPAVDAEADIVNDLIFANDSVDEIRSHHLFEHFSRVIALAQLVKWHSWLKIGGILIIETPDFVGSINQLVSKDIEYKRKMAIVRHLTGDQSASWGFHQDQWWDERYETTLSKLRFRIVKIIHTQWNRWPYLSNITVEAMKLKDVDLSDQINACLELLKESMVSEKETATFDVWKQQFAKLLEGIGGE